jgi:hypothetical protein
MGNLVNLEFLYLNGNKLEGPFLSIFEVVSAH